MLLLTSPLHHRAVCGMQHTAWTAWTRPARRNTKCRVCALIIPSDDEVQSLLGNPQQPATSPTNRSAAARRVLSQKPGTVVARRAFDVGVLGGGLTAYLIAWQLAQQGHQVALVENLGVEDEEEGTGGGSVGAVRRGLYNPATAPLVVPCLDPHTTLLSHIAARLWASLAAQHDSSILQPSGSVHFVTRASDPAVEVVEQLQSICKEAGVACSLLRAHDELTVKAPMLRVRQGVTWGLWQQEGGRLQQQHALAVIRALATRAGVTTYPTTLLGWKQHTSGHFVCRHASPLMQRAGEEVLMECGQLVLAPGTCAVESLGLFGLGAAVPIDGGGDVGGVGDEGGKEGGGDERGVEKQQQKKKKQEQPPVLGLYTTPTQWLHCPTPGRGGQQWSTMPTITLLDAHNWVNGEGPGRCVAVPAPGGGLHMRTWVGDGDEGGAGAGEGGDAAVKMLAKTYQELVLQPAPITDTKQGPMQLCTMSADGGPLLGSHPAFEDGHVLVCVAAAGGTSMSTDATITTPLLAECAASLLSFSSLTPTSDVDLARLSPMRPAVNMGAVNMTVNSWDMHLERRVQAALDAESAAAEARERALDEGSNFKDRWLPKMLRM